MPESLVKVAIWVVMFTEERLECFANPSWDQNDAAHDFAVAEVVDRLGSSVE